MYSKAGSSSNARMCRAFLYSAQFLQKAALLALAVLCVMNRPCYAIGDPIRGEKLYEESCKACHSLDRNGIGPRHRGVFGRSAGAVQGYDYSAALKNSGIVWSEETLDKWLADSQSVVPDNKMFFSVDATQERSDLIAFLKERAK
jgi:cytochrome c